MNEEDVRAWLAELLDIAVEELPSPTEDLIDHGLHSIAIMQFADRCRRAGAAIDARQLAERPSIQEWLVLLSAKGSTG